MDDRQRSDVAAPRLDERLGELLASTGGVPTDDQLAAIGKTRDNVSAHIAALNQSMNSMNRR